MRKTLASVSDIDAAVWNTLANPPGAPFNPLVSHAFFLALEQSGSATRRTGWAGRHQVLTAVTVVDAAGVARHRLSQSIVRVDRLLPADVDAYIACGEWDGKAGGYAIQGRFEAHVLWMQGSFSGIMGLPLAESRAMLRTAGLLA